MNIRVPSRVRALFGRRQMELELADELQFHLERRVAELIQQGMPQDQAERQARVELGWIGTYKDQCRETQGLRFPDELRADLRYALRTLRRAPLFTCAAIATLALGIGINTLVFSVLDHVLLRPFPFADEERLVLIWTSVEHLAPKSIARFPNYTDWRTHQRVFDEMGAWLHTNYDLRLADYADRIGGKRATASFFRTLGVQPQLGRLFDAQDERTGHDRVVVISDSCWRKR